MKKDWMSLEDASAWAKEQGVTSSTDWKHRCQNQDWCPINIPIDPAKTYGQAFKDAGGWGGFLGTGTISNKNRQFVTLEEASAWAQTKGVTSFSNWQSRCKAEGWRPTNIPSDPARVYGQAFKDAGGWVGFLNLPKYYGFSKIERMMRYVLDDCFEQKSHLGQVKARGASGKTWNVDMAYEAAHLIVEYDGAHWHKTSEALGRDTRKTKDLTATPAWHVIRLRGQPLKLIQPDFDLPVDEKQRSEHQVGALLSHLQQLHDKKRIDLPSRVLERMKSWGEDYLENYNFRLVLDRYDGFLPLEEASAWAQEQRVTGYTDWKNRCKDEGWRPTNIPSDPYSAYGQTFTNAGGWGGFLGTGKIASKNRHFLSFKEASDWAQGQRVTGYTDWKNRCKDEGWRPTNIPSDLWKVYAEEFTNAGGLGGFFGTGVVASQNRQFITLAEASMWAKEQGVTSSIDWRNRCQDKSWLPMNIPRDPYTVYRQAFKDAGGWGGFLGTNVVASQNRQFVTLEEASVWIKAQGVTTQNDWRSLCQDEGWRPTNIPSAPDKVYGQAFIDAGGWGGFLGTGVVATFNRQFVTLEEASVWAQEQGVTSSIDWRNRCKDEDWRPTNIPSAPGKVYGQAFKDAGGWVGFLRGKPIDITAPVEETHQQAPVPNSDKVFSIPKLGSLNFDRLGVSDPSANDQVIPLRMKLGKK